MQDVTAVALANSPACRAEAGATIAADGSGRLGRFQELVGGAPCSTNAHAAKVLSYGAAERILATRAHFDLVEGAEAGPAAFEASQIGALSGREGFENLWEHGRHFVYGVVNAGGIGAESYGQMCLVFRDVVHAATDALAVFPEDSVARYADVVGVVDADRARADATAWPDRGHLAVAERGAEALVASEAEWPTVVCSRLGYLEVVMAGALRPPDLAEVRLSTDLARRYHEMWQEAVAGAPLLPDAANEVAAYDVLRRWRRTSGVAIVGVES